MDFQLHLAEIPTNAAETSPITTEVGSVDRILIFRWITLDMISDIYVTDVQTNATLTN